MRTITPVTLKMLQVHANRVYSGISFFVSKTVREIRAFFLPMTKIQLKRVNLKLGQCSVNAPSTGRFRETSSGPEKSFVQHSLFKKKRQTSWIVKSFFKGAKNLKKPNTTDLEKRPAAIEAEKIDGQSTEVGVNALRRSIELFFFSFFCVVV